MKNAFISLALVVAVAIVATILPWLSGDQSLESLARMRVGSLAFRLGLTTIATMVLTVIVIGVIYATGALSHRYDRSVVGRSSYNWPVIAGFAAVPMAVVLALLIFG